MWCVVFQFADCFAVRGWSANWSSGGRYEYPANYHGKALVSLAEKLRVYQEQNRLAAGIIASQPERYQGSLRDWALLVLERAAGELVDTVSDNSGGEARKAER